MKKTITANYAKLVEIRKESTRPAETIAAAIAALGYDETAEAIAACINCRKYDGRISPRNRAWALTITTEGTSDREYIVDMDSIHPAHLDQLADAMRQAEKPAEPEAVEPEAVEPFPHLAAEIRTEYETRRKDAAHFVQFGFMPSWAEEHRTDPDRGLKQYSTPAKWAAYQAGTLSREKAVEIATRRALKEVTANEQKQIAKMETAANAPRLEWCQIAVEWVKNSYWGNNPHATATAANMTTYGKASGCGYDKQSAAVAEALNANPAALRVLYEAAEKALTDGNRPERYSNGNCTWRDVLGYGSGYSLLPYFEGGVGVSCFWEILKKCGFVCRCGASSRRFDSYTISRKEV